MVYNGIVKDSSRMVIDVTNVDDEVVLISIGGDEYI